MRGSLEPSTLVLVGLALVLAGGAYVKDPGLPPVGAKSRFAYITVVAAWLVAIFYAE